MDEERIVASAGHGARAPLAPQGGASVTAQIALLPDGRLLGFAQYGRPGGIPLIYCHGFPGSRLEAALAAPLAERLGIRLIAPDRPGFGLSSPLPGREIADWPADLAQLLRSLHIGPFHLLGVSGGAPYALAAGSLLPGVVRVGLVCGLGPLESDALAAMPSLGRCGLRIARRAPGLARCGYRLLARTICRHSARFLGWMSAGAPPVDREVLERPEVRGAILTSFRESVRQGAGAGAEELLLYARPWTIPPSACRAPVRLWHGELDATVPVAFGRRLAADLPDCRARFLPDQGHYSLPLEHLEPILRDLLDLPA
jgi:pimeloyl-ACP methyl ester carboxylesterase